MSYLIIYEKCDTGWGAYSPDLPGLVAEGETLEDVKELIHETMELHFEGARWEVESAAIKMIPEQTQIDSHA